MPLIAENPDEALPELQVVIEGGEGIYAAHRRRLFGAKLGVAEAEDSLIDGFLDMMARQGADFTGSFRSLGEAARGREGALRAYLGADDALEGWLAEWASKRTASGDEMDRVNPLYIPRNHQVEAALAAANDDDLTPMHRLLTVFADPFTKRDGYEDLETPAADGSEGYVTFCGT